MVARAKYFELRDAAANYAAAWTKYEKVCEEFIRGFIAELVKYLDAPEKRVSWLQFEEDDIDVNAELG